LWDTRYSQDLEKKISDFYGTEDTILYAAAFDANGGFLSLYLRRDAIFQIV
jgi:glycine C-acetyltransferase